MSDIEIDTYEDEDLHINFSEEEASSKARDYVPVPAGTYKAAITEIETRVCGPESKNPGKKYWAVTTNVLDGPYADRKFWANVMLFDGALYSLAQLMTAIGQPPVQGESMKVPGKEEFIGQEVQVVVSRQLDTYNMKKEKEAGVQNPVPVYKNEVKGFKPLSEGGTASSGGSGSLLP